MNETLRTEIGNHFKNTPLGLTRISRNLNLTHTSINDVELLMKSIILATDINAIESIGKNYYFHNQKFNAVLTINKHSFTIITAKTLSSFSRRQPNGA